MRKELTYLLGRVPVKVLRGLARGAWWSVYPCSAYGRLGGNDAALERILRLHACSPGQVCWDLGAHHGIYYVGIARIYQYDGFGATTSHLPYPGENLDSVAFREIPIVRLDEWVDAGRVHPPSFLKLDVEGHAVPALEGMRATLARHLPVLVVGIHSPEEHEGVRAILAARHLGELLCLPPPAR